jgi:hypothetical protein
MKMAFIASILSLAMPFVCSFRESFITSTGARRGSHRIIGLVILVIVIFLRNVSATIIPSVAVPLSLLGSLGVMKLLDFSIDTLSMMAKTLSVGFRVDDAIVMIENIVRQMEMGKPRLQVTYEGAREVGFTIRASTSISIVIALSRSASRQSRSPCWWTSRSWRGATEWALKLVVRWALPWWVALWCRSYLRSTSRR